MYHSLPSINLPPQFSSPIRNFGFTTCLRLPKPVKCSVNDSDERSSGVNSARDLGLRENEEIRELGGSRDNKVWKDESESGIDESAQEAFNFRASDYQLVKEDADTDSEMEGLERGNNRRAIDAAKSRKQMMRRSSVMAKQVISIRSALSLGFVAQLWVDTSSWVVVVVEVKPSLLSGDSERFLLKEITQVGDVVLVEDEMVMEDDVKLVGLETLVGYTVTTRRRRTIGKVRGYTFNINSGTLELLELDPFGISIIPSSLVSTYALFVDDVLEVLPDMVVVRDVAVSRLQRLSNGFWDGQSSGKELEEEVLEGSAERPRTRRKSRRNKRKSADDWELPMDFL